MADQQPIAIDQIDDPELIRIKLLASGRDVHAPMQAVVPGFEIAAYETRADAEAAIIPPFVNFVETMPALGGNVMRRTWRRVAAGPANTFRFQSADGAWWESTAERRLVFGTSQSNFRQSLAYSWEVPSNVFLWNGGSPEVETGTAFEALTGTTIRVVTRAAAEIARANPDVDFYVLIVAIGGRPIRDWIGLDYEWSTDTAASDPGSGFIKINNSDPSLATSTYFSELDTAGKIRFVGGTKLDEVYITRIEKIGDEANTYVEFMAGATTDEGDYRSAPLTYSDHAGTLANGDPVRIWSGPRMDQMIENNMVLVEAAIGNATADIYFQWMNEGDVAYFQNYAVDWEVLRTNLLPRVPVGTQTVLYQPWPHSLVSPFPVSEYYKVGQEIIKADPTNRSYVDLREIPDSMWDASIDYLHLLAPGIDLAGKIGGRAALGIYWPAAPGLGYKPSVDELSINAATLVQSRAGGTPLWTLSGDTGAGLRLRTYNASAGTGPQPRYELGRARGTIASPAIVNNGDFLGFIDWYAYDGAAFVASARLFASVAETTPSTTALGVSFGVLLNAAGSVIPTSAMTINHTTGLTLFGGVTIDGSRHLRLRSYTVATIPSAAVVGQMIYVSDESGGQVPAFSDGVNWLRVTDRAVVS